MKQPLYYNANNDSLGQHEYLHFESGLLNMIKAFIIGLQKH